MALALSSSVALQSHIQGKKKRSRDPEIRTLRSQIYHPVNGKSCHQCRQKTTNFVAECNNKNANKQCPIKFCFKCLWNRYAEKAEEVALVSDWKCPKCRGICNCSNCMKKRGQSPTGILAPVAKKSGFSSVSEMLNIGGAENLNAAKSPDRIADLDKDPVIPSPKKRGKENSCNVDGDIKLNPKKTVLEALKEMPIGHKEDDCYSKRPKISLEEDKSKMQNDVFLEFPSERQNLCKQSSDAASQQDSGLSEVLEYNDAGAELKQKRSRAEKIMESPQHEEVEPIISLPHGADLMSVAGIDLPSSSVGQALQFLEFCAAFGKALDLRKGRAESILREIVQGRDRRRCQNSSAIQFHIQLLQLIQEELGEDSESLSPTDGENSWLTALEKCISDSDVPMMALPSAVDGYAKLDPSEKLRMLIFLCDEALGTAYFRDWIDEQNSKFVDTDKVSRQKVYVAKEKEKHLKKKLQDEVAATIMANKAPFSVSEHEALAAQIRDEMAQAHTEVLEAMNRVPIKGEICAAVRTVPLFLDDSGRAFWKLKCHPYARDLLLQEVGARDSISSEEEKWVIYNAEQKPEVEKYINCAKLKRLGNKK